METEVSMERNSRAGAIAYWALVVFLIGFGCLGLLSIGFPFLLLGIGLAIVARRRHETGVVVATVASVIGFTLGYILVAPLGCNSGSSSAHPVAHTVCTNILGIDYSGVNPYTPPLLPGLLADLATAVVFALVAHAIARRIAHDRRNVPAPSA
jgi:hypothetical protein